MIIKAFFDEILCYDIVTVWLHCKWMITKSIKDEKKYYIYSQKKAKEMSENKIARVMIRRFYRRKHERLDFRNPLSFDQKIQWLMLYDATPLKTKLVDKYLVREYIKETIGNRYLVPLVGCWNSFDEIDFSQLPKQFVLKVNSGSGMNIIVKNKDCFDRKAAKEKFDYWMSLNFAYFGFEMQYRDVPLKILAEEYIEQIDGNLYDYKFHCFNGFPYCCQVIGNRNIERHTAQQAFFDMEWNALDISEGSYPIFDKLPTRPSNLDEMVNVAKKLSKGFCYVRVDLYSIESSVLFSEMTFTPAIGIHPGFKPKEIDIEWGNRIELPEPYFLDIPKS